MIDLLSGLDAWVLISLFFALAFVLAFEFINGFHDTANAVATVIYTKAMPPHLAVFFSGVFNFLGVLLGGVGVAYAIVHLLPVELLVNVNTGHGLAMVFSLLAAAITWNLGTWYFGIPASSSHTLIGSILGVGLANALVKFHVLGTAQVGLNSGAGDERLGRNAVQDNAVTAHALVFNNGDFCTIFGACQRGLIAGRAAADDDDSLGLVQHALAPLSAPL